MAEYINIRGQSIEVVASDPANPTVGQIWYNSTSNTLKGGGVTTAGAWATGNNMNTSRAVELGSCGTQTAALAVWWCFGPMVQEQQKNMMEILGQHSPGSLNTARQCFSRRTGTQTAGLAFGGFDTPLFSSNRRI
jgi:hypothetical protein